MNPDDQMSDQIIQEHIRDETYPNIWAPAETLAKSAFEMIVADLGQASPPTMLTDGEMLQAFTANFSAINKGPMANAWPGPATRSDDELRNETGPLLIIPLVISARYLCQFPRMRAPISLVVSVMVADLVFLQAAWQLYKPFTGWWLTRRIPDSDWCKGCVDMKHREMGLSKTELTTLVDTTSGVSHRFARLRGDEEADASDDG
ncbi:hypothetical protein PG996_013944 [Apiospora saccharicola]|uniref:Uncharacterized protein n=1 Tax=Apiospora saccharicola TaxID=335842 RepID=A0ABR1TGX4_9PEZI